MKKFLLVLITFSAINAAPFRVPRQINSGTDRGLIGVKIAVPEFVDRLLGAVATAT